MGKLQSLDKMEAGIYSIVEIHSFRNMHLTIIVHMYNEQRNTHVKLLPESKAKVPKWDKHTQRERNVCHMQYEGELKKVTTSC